MEFLKGLVDRGVLSESNFPNQLTVNRYEVGAGTSAYEFISDSSCVCDPSIIQYRHFPNSVYWLNFSLRTTGIPAHCDTHSMFFSCIVVVSLGASIMMDFCGKSRTVSVPIPRRSVMVMQDESRYGWTHRSVSFDLDTSESESSWQFAQFFRIFSIAPRKYDLMPRSTGAPLVIAREVRTSFTFRRVRPETPCDCEFPSLCDSRMKFALDDSNASQLERLHVHEVDSLLADKSSSYTYIHIRTNIKVLICRFTTTSRVTSVTRDILSGLELLISYRACRCGRWSSMSAAGTGNTCG